jgi:hypothetical protein
VGCCTDTGDRLKAAFRLSFIHEAKLIVYSSPNNIRVIKSRRTRKEVHVACTGRTETCKNLWSNRFGRKSSL